MMNLSPIEPKKLQIMSLIRKMRKSDSEILVSEYCYNCFFSGNLITKTLIVFPDEVDTKGIISIDKPLIQVEIPDIIKLYKRVIS